MFIFIFWSLGVREMAEVNIASVAIYITLYVLAKNKSLTFIGSVAYTEVVVHSTLATIAVG